MNISPIDRYLSTLLLEKLHLEKLHFDFFAFLFGAAREGHLYVKISKEIEPSILSGWEMEVMPEEFGQALFSSYDTLRHLDLDPFVFFEGERVMLKMQKELQVQVQDQLLRLKEQIFLVTGAPGTGKTTFVKELLEQFAPQEVILLAPTGRAANHLKNTMSKEIESSTLYSFLKKKDRPFAFKCIVVDESSMIDAMSMSQLLQGISAFSRLYLVGDPDQLPPIQGASFFADFVAIYKKANHPNLIEKTINYRTHSKEILEFANAIKNEQFSFFDLVFTNQLKSIQMIENQETIAYPFFSELGAIFDPKAFFEKMHQLVMLTPFNQGEGGVELINQNVLNFLLSKGKDQVSIPVLLNKTIYPLNLFNGDIGMLILEKKDHYSFHAARVYFQIEGKIEFFYAHMLSRLVPAFCISIHKSQGSEYDQVILILDKRADVFGKELLYTAATRAKTHLFLKGKGQDYLLVAKRQNNLLSQLEIFY